MTWFRAFLSRCRALLRAPAARARDDQALREEFAFHVAMETEENLRRGMSHEEARRAALLSAGGLTAAAESVRERVSMSWVEHLLTDLRYAARSLRHNPGFTTAVVLTLSLVIGANATMFTIVNAVVLRPLPFPHPEQVLSLALRDDRGNDFEEVDNVHLDAWLGASRSLQAIAVAEPLSAILRGGRAPRSVKTTYAMRSYFDVIHVAPERGRLFTFQEDRPGEPRIALISDQLWRSEFGADPHIIGRSIVLDDSSTTIVGVMPASLSSARGTQIWVPLRREPPKPGVTRFYDVVARMKPGVDIDAVRAELATISATIKRSPMAPPFQTQPVVMTLHDRRFGDVRRPLYLLLAAVSVLLLIACLNLANLAMARSVRRQREFSLRRALGAQGARLVRYVLLEGLVLSVGGATLGLGLAFVSIRAVVALSPATVARVDGITVDARVVMFTVAMALATAVVFGLVPAIASARGDLNQVLSAGSGRTVGGSRQRRVRRVLVVAELATSLMLLSGAGLVAKSFWRVTEIDPGFHPDKLVAAEVDLPYSRYADTAASNAFFKGFMERVRAIPSVQSAVLADAPPLGGARFSFSTGPDHRSLSAPRFEVLGVGADYFRLLGIGVLEGRLLEPTDGVGAQPVAVVSRTAARLLFPDGRPVGRSFSFGGNAVTIVGVVTDVHVRGGLEGAPSAAVFAPVAQLGTGPSMTILFRTAGDPDAAERAIAGAFESLEPTQPPPTFTTMDKVLSDEMTPRRFLFVLLGTFAGLAAVLAVLGLYAVLSFLVNEQTREIGIRSALGADRSRVLRHVMAHGTVMIGAGAALGIGASLIAVKALSTQLYKVQPRDPATLALAALLLVVTAALACYIPARRASHLDPLIALRVD